MRLRLTFGWLLILSLMAAIGYAQQPPATAAPAPAQAAGPVQQLSLADALTLARQNNPDYRSTLNDRWQAVRQVTSATSQLFLPTARISGSAYSTGAGTQTLGGVSFPSPGGNRQSWNLSLDYQMSGTTFANRGLYSAQLRAVDENVSGASVTLETTVRRQYLSVLRTRAQEALAQRSLERAQEGLNLAQARNAVGQGTLIDVRREQVNVGDAEVAVLKAHQDVENQQLILFQDMGVTMPAGGVVLTDSFAVVEPRWDLEGLMQQALDENPALRSLRARQNATTWGMRAARSEYLPTLSVSAGYGKFQQCCELVRHIDPVTSDTTFTNERTFGVSPWNIFAQLSLPIFDGFQRNVDNARARAADDDARQAIRARELGVRAEVTAAFHTVQQAYQTIPIRDAGRTASAEALQLATDRYRLGSGSYLDLLDARVAAEKADADYISAIYDYHTAIANLENAVGRALR